MRKKDLKRCTINVFSEKQCTCSSSFPEENIHPSILQTLYSAAPFLLWPSLWTEWAHNWIRSCHYRNWSLESSSEIIRAEKWESTFYGLLNGSKAMYKPRAKPAKCWALFMNSTLDQGVINAQINIFILCLNNLSSLPLIRLCWPNLLRENTHSANNCLPLLTQAGVSKDSTHLLSWLPFLPYSFILIFSPMQLILWKRSFFNLFFITILIKLCFAILSYISYHKYVVWDGSYSPVRKSLVWVLEEQTGGQKKIPSPRQSVQISRIFVWNHT